MNWTDEKNERRCDLIDKQIDCNLDLDEHNELLELAEELHAHIIENTTTVEDIYDASNVLIKLQKQCIARLEHDLCVAEDSLEYYRDCIDELEAKMSGFNSNWKMEE